MCLGGVDKAFLISTDPVLACGHVSTRSKQTRSVRCRCKPKRSAAMGTVPETLVQRLEAVAAKLERYQAGLNSSSPAHTNHHAAAAAPAAPSSAASGDSVGAYGQLMSSALQPLMSAAGAIGGEVLQVTQHVQGAFQEQGKLLAHAAKSKAPEPAQLQSLLAPVAGHMVGAQGLADQRGAKAVQQLKVAAEALQGLGWLAYAGPTSGMPAPAQHVRDSWAAAEFYANKLLMQYRGVDEAQVAWVKALKDLMQQLEAYVKAHHPRGISWNPAGAAAGAPPSSTPAAAAAASKPAAEAAAGPGPKQPPPPPPPPPPGLLLQERPAAGSGAAAGGGGGATAAGGGAAELLKAIAQGDGVTKGLRKVTDDMKSKNRADRSGLVPQQAPGAAPAAAAAPAAGGPKAVVKGPPRTVLEQERKWMVENHEGNQEIVLSQTDSRQTVYIYNCHKSVIQVQGKVNTISLDKCSRTGLVFDDVIATVEVVNCQSVQVQCKGRLPTMSIDKCDGCQLFISKAVAGNPDFQVVTAKSSEVNVVVMADNPEKEDAVEHAVPEQFVSNFKDGKLVTTAASHGGG